MKKILLALFVAGSLFWGCGGNSSSGGSVDGVVIEGTLAGPCRAPFDSVRVLQAEGGAYRPIASAALVANADQSSFTFQLNVGKDVPQGIYYLMVNDVRDMRAFVIEGGDVKLDVTGPCGQMAAVQIPNSAVNNDYVQLMSRLSTFDQQAGALGQQFRVALQTGNVDAIKQQYKTLNQQKVATLDEYKKKNPFLGKIAALKTYLHYQGLDSPEYPTEAEYFASDYFKYADLKDEAYNTIPTVFEAAKQYASVLSQVGMDAAKQQEYVNKVLSQIPNGTKAHNLALWGALEGFRDAKNDANFIKYANDFIASYPQTNAGYLQMLQQQIGVASTLAVGSEAPNISMKTPDGKELSLSDLRGNIVLVDFWASWCRPCRKENPHVLKLYDKYKGKGFEILGVSLDRNQTQWEKAIQQDGLKWKHVSDLKQWNNEAARTYQVGSIPYTVLVDKEGKIIAKQLRHQQLAVELQRLFGA